MAQHKAADTEPTMEEILASIRRIISEDGEGDQPSDGEGEAAAQTQEVEAEAEQVEFQELVEETAEEEVFPEAPEPEPDADEVIELTEIVQEEEEPAPAPRARYALSGEDGQEGMQDQDYDSDGLLSSDAVSKASMALGSLAPEARISRPGGAGSIEEVVRDLLRPMLREWLEDNLPALVEEMVEREIRRVTTRARR
ncbi:MAG: DUF2497 domain-containing protein [Alphaproteobacteria bacterium]|nr:DUF2497 domain-containing protein [Alphaproteobacteria bacterium]